MENGKRSVHVLALPYPGQGHLNPMLQFCRRLVSKGVKSTLAITTFMSNSMNPKSDTVAIDTISDGFDEGGFKQAGGDAYAYLASFETVGSKTLADLIERNERAGHPIDCIAYDSFMPWALDVARRYGLAGASFFTQPCAVNFVYYYTHHGLLPSPVTSPTVSIPGMPLLELQDMPSLVSEHLSLYPAYFELLSNQFSNLDETDFVLVNSFYKLEDKVVDAMSKVSPLVMTIGPTIPSFYLDKRVKNDTDYGINLFKFDHSVCLEWLKNKPNRSVVYVSFGSMADLTEEQMDELAWGFKDSNCYFLWVVRATEAAKLPEKFVKEVASDDKGLIVEWCPQLEVLANEVVGCFFSHCGWNSTIEALSLGVPMVVMPIWTDQMTNSKYVQDVWKVGIRVKMDEKGIVGRKEIESCVREVMEGERGKEMRKNALKWSECAKEAVSEGGTSDKAIDEFVSKLSRSRRTPPVPVPVLSCENNFVLFAK